VFGPVTVAVAVKVFDGIVLATDSATTVTLTNPDPNIPPIHQVYNSGVKLFHLHRDNPIGAMTWGGAEIGSASISTLAKDLRRRFMGLDPDHLDWALQDDYTIEAVADRLIEMMFDELYAPLGIQNPVSFFVAGFSGSETKAEAFEVLIDDPATRPTAVRAWDQDASGWRAYGTPDAAARLFLGVDLNLKPLIPPLVDPAQHPTLDLLFAMVERSPVVSPMPFAEAIDLARFLVDTTIGYSRFLFGPNTVGGPVDVAGISRHEGFKWVARKHYYPSDLNPTERPHAHDQ
jgi:hypothetical protein